MEQLDRYFDTGKNIQYISSCLILFIMCGIGLYASVNMLSWMINHKKTTIQEVAASEVTAQVRQRQLECLAKNIYYEAGSEPFEGKVAVAQVTLNRSTHADFPSDICRVIYQKNVIYEKIVCQFSWYCDRKNQLKPIHNEAYEESMIVAKKVLLEGFRLPSLVDALYYHADYVNPKWNKQRITKIGRHIFYK